MDSFKRALKVVAKGGGYECCADPVPPSAPGVLFAERLPTLAESADLLVAEAMQRAQENQTIAAGLLGISRQALSKRLKKQAC